MPMQPSPRADTSKPLFPSFRVCISILLGSGHDPDRRGAGDGTDHRVGIGAVTVFRSVSLVDAVIDLPVDRFELDLSRHPSSDNSTCLLPDRGLMPARASLIVSTHVEVVVDRDGPDPG